MVTDWGHFAVAACLITSGLLALPFVVWLWPQRIPRGYSVGEIRARVLAESAAPMHSCHSAPRHRLGELEAYRTLGGHRHCTPGDGATVQRCGRKAAALHVLPRVPDVVSTEPESGDPFIQNKPTH